jgi:hypothetical protein
MHALTRGQKEERTFPQRTPEILHNMTHGAFRINLHIPYAVKMPQTNLLTRTVHHATKPAFV